MQNSQFSAGILTEMKMTQDSQKKHRPPTFCRLVWHFQPVSPNRRLVVTSNNIQFTIVYDLAVMIFRIFYNNIQFIYNLIYIERKSSRTYDTYKLHRFHLWISAKEIVNIWKITSSKLKFWRGISQRLLVQSICFKCSSIRFRTLAFTWCTSNLLEIICWG